MEAVPILLVAFGVLALAGVVVVLVMVVRRLDRLARENRENQGLSLLQQQVESLRGQFSDSLERNLGRVTQSLDERLRVVGEVQTKLGMLEEASRKMIDIGKDISSLQHILKAPKVRGGIGEFFLGNLLSQMLPAEHYALQHGFKSGERVDAVIKVGDRVVPVDAKFPLENFRRLAEADDEQERRVCRRTFLGDVKKHVDSMAGKYILPEEGTYDFAMMYIPAESVYYEIIVRPEDGGSLLEYALARRVIPVSPNSLFAYLQVIIMGLRGMRVEESAREIISRISGLRVVMEKHRDDFRKLGVHIRNAGGAYEAAEKRLDRMSLELEKLESPGTRLEVPGVAEQAALPAGGEVPGEG